MANIFSYTTDPAPPVFFPLGVLDCCGFLGRKRHWKTYLSIFSQKVHFDTKAECSTLHAQEGLQCVNNWKTKMNNACSHRTVGREGQMCTQTIQCENIQIK